MRRRLLFLVVAAAIAILYSWRLGARSFWEPDEPRYSEVGREMLASGDWVVPRLNFIKYYEKPPLTYWSAALSFAAFGESEGAARLGPVLAALLLIAAAWMTARALYDARSAALGAVILALSPMAWVTGRLLLTDMFLSAGVAWAVAGFALGLRALEDGRSPNRAMAVAGLGFAAAVLAKGPIGVLIPLFGIVPLRILARKGGALGARAWAIAAGVTLALAAPWFVLISIRDHAFAWFFFVNEHVLRYATPAAHREGAPYYYLVIILVGLFPASILIPWAVRRVWPGFRPRTLADRGTVLLGALAIFTFIFFSVSHSKLPGYILPAVPALALIVARALALALGGRGPEEEAAGGPAGAPVGLRVSLALAGLVALGGAATLAVFAARGALGVIPEHLVVVLGILTVCLAFVLGSAALSRRIAVLGRHLPVAGGVVALMFLNLNSIGESLDPLQTVKSAARFVTSKAVPGDVVASYRTLLQGLTFYCGRRTTVIGGPGELAFGFGLEPPGEWLLERKALPGFLDRRRAYIVVPAEMEEGALRDGRGRLRRILDGPKFKVLSNEPVNSGG